MSKNTLSPPPNPAAGLTYVVGMTVGSVGKSTLARHVLHAHMPVARMLSVESATPDGQESDLYQRGQDQVREALRFELFSRETAGKIIDCGVTDSELVAEVVTELAAIGRAAHITVILPVLCESKGLRGLEHFAALLPAGVCRLAILTQVEDEAADKKFRAGKYGQAVQAYCTEHSIALCPTPFLRSDLLDTSAAVHAIAMSGRTLAEVGSIDLDALSSGSTARDRAAAAQLGLLIGAAAMAPAALANTRAIYQWIVDQESGDG